MLLTYGHATDSSERTVATLRGAAVASVVDIRTAPGSRRNPQFARAAMSEWLPEAGICYRWEKRLGGFRKPGPDNPDVAWREDMFRGYAEHMRSADFLDAIDGVLTEAAGRQACGCEPTACWFTTQARPRCCDAGGRWLKDLSSAAHRELIVARESGA